MNGSPLEPAVLFHLGVVPVTRHVATTWAIMAVLGLGFWLSTRRLASRPGRWQTCLEVLVETLAGQVREVMGRDPSPFLPLLASLFIFLVVANLSMLLPVADPPTAHLETTGALALIVFFSVHYFGIRSRGLWAYLKHYARPNLLMLPLNVASEITRTFSLMVRLFGNIMSHEFAIGIVIALAGVLVPIPLMALSILVGLVQAYIFTVLATVFIGAAVGDAAKG